MIRLRTFPQTTKCICTSNKTNIPIHHLFSFSYILEVFMLKYILHFPSKNDRNIFASYHSFERMTEVNRYHVFKCKLLPAEYRRYMYGALQERSSLKTLKC